MKKTICIVLVIFFTAVIAYSGYRMFLIGEDYRHEAVIHNSVMEYKPAAAIDPNPGAPGATQEAGEIVNQDMIKMREVYPDAVGWLTVPNTRVDYPFVQSADNDYYLRRDINGKAASTGSIFMDFRCNKDFTSPNTIIYGHHTKNSSMFGSLESFNNSVFFESNKYGYIYLPHANLTLEYFAYMVVHTSDREIYDTQLSDTYFDYIKQNARYYRELELTDADRIVTLSSCSYEFSNARLVLLARIKEN